MPATKPLRAPRTDVAPSTDEQVNVEKSWNVVVWNDPVTPMGVVTLILRKIFGYPNAKATNLMLQVHNHGRAIVWSGVRARAEGYCVKVQANGLLCSVEQDA